MPSNKKLLQAAAGSAGGDNLYVEDVFSTYLYTGNGSTQNIVNGIDLSGEGGFVWTKRRDGSGGGGLFNTAGGVGNTLFPSTASAYQTYNASTQDFRSFNSNGFSLNGTEWTGNVNNNGNDFTSWSFRKAAGFCDIVTYSGDSSASKQISHNLGSTPAMILIKQTDGSVNWAVFHKDLPGSNGTGKGFLSLNTNDNNSVNTNCFSTLPTSTHFTVNANYGATNASGASYVAYLFGDDAIFGEDGDEQICKMGSYTADSSNAYFVDLGFEPQWVIIKKTSGDGDWEILDTMRGFGADAANDQILKANSSNAEASDYGAFISSTGFYGSNQSGANGSTYIYMAIRRPMKVPEAGTEVFIANEGTPGFTTGFPVDFNINTVTGSTSNRYAISRLTGVQYLETNGSDTQATGTGAIMFNNGTANTKIDLATNWFAGVSNVISWSFKRAPKFMDVVAYTGTGSNRTLTHNLSIAPEMIWVKNRNSSQHWAVYHKHYGGTHWANLNEMDGFATSSTIWNNTNTTSSVFTVGTASNTNQSSQNYIAYLFGSLDGVSKVGSYTGNGSTQTIDCGFSAGARFVLIKKSSEYGNYMVFDSVRGIVSGNDPYIMLDNTNAEVTNTDKVDPAASGFAVNVGDGYQSDANESGQTYIFLAIA